MSNAPVERTTSLWQSARNTEDCSSLRLTSPLLGDRALCRGLPDPVGCQFIQFASIQIQMMTTLLLFNKIPSVHKNSLAIGFPHSITDGKKLSLPVSRAGGFFISFAHIYLTLRSEPFDSLLQIKLMGADFLPISLRKGSKRPAPEIGLLRSVSC